MMNRITVTIASTFFSLITVFPATIYAEPSPKDVLAAMKKASAYMAETVSTHGGYVDKYTPDLSRRWGEVPARETQIACQPPGTPAMGTLFLDAYKATGETAFLRYAEMAANALIWGQHPAGGWHYIIDFDMPGIRKWYDEVASKCWGWEEYYHYYGNCSFDDMATYAPAKFLLDLYMTTYDPKYRAPLVKALDFILAAQYPNGAWPQRYPLMYDYPHGGHDDYTHYYTFNDGAIQNNIMLLFEAWEKLGNEAYRDAAVRGMDFYIASQLGEPQAGWAQQYTMDMQPGWARTYEPAAVSCNRTMSNINFLQRYFTMTGDRRYLEPIPAAIAWIERSALTSGASSGGTHAGFYEVGTNEPLYYHFEGTGPDDYRCWVDHEIEGAWWYRRSVKPDIAAMKRSYERYARMTSEDALAEHEASKAPDESGVNADPNRVEEIINALDSNGAWITTMRVRQYDKGMLDPSPVTDVEGIDISVFIRNMSVLIDYIAHKE